MARGAAVLALVTRGSGVAGYAGRSVGGDGGGTGAGSVVAATGGHQDKPNDGSCLTGICMRISTFPYAHRILCMQAVRAKAKVALPRCRPHIAAVRTIIFNTGTSMARALFLSIAALFLVAGCENADSLRIEETRSKLVGTWLRDDGTDGEKSLRLLYLGADGKFVDSISMSNSEGRIERTELSGEWSYDGKSLKRRFLQENGRQFSGGRMRYATFTLVSAETSEFVVNDNIVGR